MRKSQVKNLTESFTVSVLHKTFIAYLLAVQKYISDSRNDKLAGGIAYQTDPYTILEPQNRGEKFSCWSKML